MNVFIGGAWPYANGSLHLGHIASLLPGDILARYFRLTGRNVLYVSGSDCNGTPIAIRAKEEQTTPKQIADYYHKEFVECFSKLGFTYDLYTRTDSSHHHQIAQKIFLELLENNFIYKKEIEQTYCEACSQFLPDRYVEGICPICGNAARGDQCDHCSTILDPIDLLEKTCKICGTIPEIRKTEHFYFSLSQFQESLELYVANAKTHHSWRENAIQLTYRYFQEGLHDRAVSRDLPVGINIPVKGYEDKKIYVWIEAVAGYLSASIQWGKEHQVDDAKFWDEDSISYYVHGKDNIPFHTIIWPAILIAIKKKSLPTHIVSNEYLTIEKKKLSTSRNWAVWIPDLIERYHPDSIRYFLTVNAPENKDTDFSWREFIYSHNSELLGTYGNFVHRSLKFIEKYYKSVVPDGNIDPYFDSKIANLYKSVGNQIEGAHFKRSLEIIFDFIREANKYFDQEQPWKQIQEDKEACNNTLANCVFIIANLAQLLEPFLPFSSTELFKKLKIANPVWQTIKIKSLQLEIIEPLFERIDINQIEYERGKLLNQ
ncbi:methionine--tRNA ligase [Heyndrickxia oleronia]|uniref:Methionine--tRNA ligase n=1 Tax=Heyndrickxia oleronia TaxID=38875 RepID=A0AAW6SWP6_9BACI|nr:methionine--tRNA ligase [Heyndrickxia oleronia]MDH5162678.1 methionine--tRNA ligase [Heyndrickxia oleronia]